MKQLELLDVIDESLVNPKVRVWPGTPHSPMPTLVEAYAEGRERGLSWPKDKWQHVPGGPWAHSGLPNNHSLAPQARHSQGVHREWLRGWHDGFREQCGDMVPVWYRSDWRTHGTT